MIIAIIKSDCHAQLGNSTKSYKISSSASQVTMPDKLIKIGQYIKPDKYMTASDYVRKFLGASLVTHLNMTKSKNLGNWIAFRLEHLPAYNVIKHLLRTKLLSDYIPTYNTPNIFEELSCFPTMFWLTILSNAFGNIEQSHLLSFPVQFHKMLYPKMTSYTKSLGKHFSSIHTHSFILF